MLHVASVVLNILAGTAGLIAAASWLRASAVVGPSGVAVSVGVDGSDVDLGPLKRYVHEAGRLNRIAARWSAIAAACAALGTLAGL
jgi:hypothetical protein